MANPRQVKGLVPAKNKNKIGLANQSEEKFFTLDFTYLNVWLLCNGKRSEDQICKDFIKFLKTNLKEKVKVDEKKLCEEVKTIIKKLKKFNLLE